MLSTVQLGRMIGLIALAAVTAGCGAGSQAGPPATSAPASGRPTSPPPSLPGPSSADPTSPGGLSAADWPTYHRTADRAGIAPTTPPLGKLSRAWTAHLDGAVYAQPLVVGDRVLVATEGDSLYALERSTGRQLWRVRVGEPVLGSDLPCGNIDPLGITGTPVYDPATGLVFAVAETRGFHHLLVGVEAATGAVKVRRDIPTPDGQPRFNQQRAALALAHDRVYVAFGGLLGDCGPYVGSVVAARTDGSGPLLSYRVPTRREAGIWATGGPTVGADGNIYVEVGNGAATTRSEGYDHSDSVLQLSPDLALLSFFAPTSWPSDNASDLDLGSMSPVVLPDGQVLAAGKNGTAYLLRADDLGGIGGQVASRQVCRAFGGPAHDGTTAYLPCISGGPAAVRLSGSSIQVLWRGPGGANGSPVVGGGAVWVLDWNAGRLYALGADTGKTRTSYDVGPVPHFASPTLSKELVLVGTNTGVVAVSGA